MPLNTKTVKGIEYVYFRSYDSETKKHVDTYIGRKDAFDASLKSGGCSLDELAENMRLLAAVSKMKMLAKTLEEGIGGKADPLLFASLRKDIVSIENALPPITLPKRDRLPSKEAGAIRRLKNALADSTPESKKEVVKRLKQMVREAEEPKNQ